jgi:hypothetical protein
MATQHNPHNALSGPKRKSIAEIFESFTAFDTAPRPCADSTFSGTTVTATLAAAQAASKAGRRKEAFALYTELINAGTTSVDICTGFGWEAYRLLKALSPEKEADAIRAASVLGQYVTMSLPRVKKPSLLCSLMIVQMNRFSTSNRKYLAQMQCVGDDAFRDEDFERFKPADADRDFNGLVENTIKSVYHAALEAFKWASNESTDDRTRERVTADARWGLSFVERHVVRFPVQEWFPYYYGKLLIENGDFARARQFVVSIVKSKPNEFWVWDVMASTFEHEQGDERLWCLCRALTCRAREDFLVRVRQRLAALLVQKQLFDAARTEIVAIVNVRESKNWKIPPEVQSWMQASWYREAAAGNDNAELYQSAAACADALLYDASDWTPAVVTGSNQKKGDPRMTLFVGWMEGDTLRELGTRIDSDDEISRLQRGAPVRLILGNGHGHHTVQAITQRDGQAWDAIPEQIGIVKHVNGEKGITSVALSRSVSCLVPHQHFSDTALLQPGDRVAVRARFEKQRNRYCVMTIAATTREVSDAFVRSFSGRLRPCADRQFGFVADVYISRALMCALPGEDDIDLRGLAVCEWNPKKDAYTWRAVTVISKEDV